MINTITKRKQGERNPHQKTLKELLRRVQSEKKGIHESEIRDFTKQPPLNISVQKTVRNHLNNLETKYRLLIHEFVEGKGNTWYSSVHNKINTDFRNCGLPELTTPQKNMIDFLIKYSDSYIDMLFKKTDWHKVYENARKIEKTAWNYSQKKLSIPDLVSPFDDNLWFIAVAENCLIHDYLFNGLDFNNVQYQKDYQEAYSGISLLYNFEEHKAVMENIKM